MNSRSLIGGILAILLAAGAVAINPMQGELEIVPATRLENAAGVWVDGQYVGYVGNLRGRGALVLVPGEHELTFKLVGYREVTGAVVVEPGEKKRYRVAMEAEPDLAYPDRDETAKIRIEVEPDDAAIFVNDDFVGHVDRFDGFSGMRLKAGTYRFTIALPGYEPFETELTLRAGQTYEIKTKLPPGSLDEQADPLTTKE